MQFSTRDDYTVQATQKGPHRLFSILRICLPPASSYEEEINLQAEGEDCSPVAKTNLGKTGTR
jgi:hypothetical protein